jgi:nitric oxide synthase-interacting protein
MTPSKTFDPHAEPGTDQGMVRCYVCEEDVTERPLEKFKGKDGKGKGKGEKEGKERIKPGLVEIKSEGTGFSGAGSNMVVRDGVAFQC